MIEREFLFPLNVLTNDMELMMIFQRDNLFLYIVMILGFLEIVI